MGLTPQLIMRRPDLADLPAPAPPAGYWWRSFRPGDEAAWVEIIDDSFGGQHPPEWFHERLGDGAFRPERVWFIGLDRRPVGTASAWVKPRWGPTAGVLHMVGLATAWRGRGLSRPICLAALAQMRREGHREAFLETDDHRLPAIRCYLGLGFRPYLVHENQRQRWRAVLTAGGRAGAFEDLLTGPVTER